MAKKDFVGQSVRKSTYQQIMNIRPNEHASFNDTLEFMLQRARDDGDDILGAGLRKGRTLK